MNTDLKNQKFVFGVGIRVIEPEDASVPVQRAAARFLRDCRMVLTADGPGSVLKLCRCGKKVLEEEQFAWSFEDERTMILEAGDDLGFIFGLLEISRRFLGIRPFWFWMDQQFVRSETAEIPIERFVCAPYRVRFRGWFINDEVLLMKWNLDGDNQKSWEMAMEALLRCGGNLVIPGTDKNSRRNRQLAADMGLWITHHHAEPLGAEMFARAYPDLQASYKQYPELFEKLWLEAIEAQKENQVIWTLGFRGQGDHPFWENDPQYASDESRGRLISRVIRRQYDMVHSRIPDAVCCTNLYGEIMDLYRKGFITLPDDVIRIWADNGFGRMVSRRQENINPRVDALPGPEESEGHHGLYYHVSFYDLQAANHITMLPNSTDFVAAELEECYDRGIRDFWIINSSNIKPHVFNLELVSRLWRETAAAFDPAAYAADFAALYYEAAPELAGKIGFCYDGFARNSIVYGPNEDDHAGEQFTNYVTRILNWAFRKGEKGCVVPLLWATGEKPFAQQVRWFYERCSEREESYRAYLKQCEECLNCLEGVNRQHFEDGIWLQANMYYDGLMGAVSFCKAVFAFEEEKYLDAFYLAGQASDWFQDAENRMRAREHGHWKDFYFNECLSDFKYTAYEMRQLMGHIRNCGDGPHGFLWMKEICYSANDRKISLISHTDNHPTDEALYEAMKQKRH